MRSEYKRNLVKNLKQFRKNLERDEREPVKAKKDNIKAEVYHITRMIRHAHSNKEAQLAYNSGIKMIKRLFETPVEV